MILGRQLLKKQDLVLKVSPNVDPAKFDMGKCGSFLKKLDDCKKIFGKIS